MVLWIITTCIFLMRGWRTPIRCLNEVSVRKNGPITLINNDFVVWIKFEVRFPISALGIEIYPYVIRYKNIINKPVVFYVFNFSTRDILGSVFFCWMCTRQRI